MKNSFYFDHDYNARGDQKILCLRAKFDWKGYGLFFATLECLCESNGFIKREALSGVSLGFNLPESEYNSFIDFCIQISLLKENEDGVFSERILEHLQFRQKLSDAGKRGGRGNKATIKPPFSHPKATPEAGKESKGEESKEKKPKKIFIPPILEDVKTYFKDNGYSEQSSVRFFNYYSTAEWKDSQGKQVRNWKQKALGVWFKPENKITTDISKVTYR